MCEGAAGGGQSQGSSFTSSGVSGEPAMCPGHRGC